MLHLHPLAKIVCGEVDGNSVYFEIIMRMRKNISQYAEKLFELNISDPDQRMIVSFYARGILEAVGTTLLARLDPFRVLLVYQVQSSANYDITKRSNTALQWTGDILPNNRAKADMWSPDHKITDYDRALFSDYNGELFWKPGFLKVNDYIQENTLGGDWIERLKSVDENNFFERNKNEAGQLFSAFSKGIHYEFLINAEHVYDEATVSNNINKLVRICGEMGLVSHFIDGMKLGMDQAEVFQTFSELEGLIEQWRRTAVEI